MRRLLPAFACLLASACGGAEFETPSTLQAAPATGLPAIQFTQTVRLLDGRVHRLEVLAGTVLVADRTRNSDGAPLWCGPASAIADGVNQLFIACFVREAQRLTLDRRGPVASAELPTGATREFRLR